MQSPLQNQFRRSLRNYFLSNVENVHFLIARKEVRHPPSPAIPRNVTAEDEVELISAYISSKNPSSDYLEIFANSKEIPTRIRLAAQKWARDITAKVFNSAATFNFGIEVLYTEQEETVKAEFSGGTTKYHYDINWILKNPDKPTLLNNFINLFNYIDSQGRLTLCFQISRKAQLFIRY